MKLFGIDFSTDDYGKGVAIVTAPNAAFAFSVLKQYGRLNSQPNQYHLLNCEVVSYESVFQVPTLTYERFTDAIYYKGEKGEKGTSSLQSIVYKRSIEQPNTPEGGSYEYPVPEGWSRSVPLGNDKVWMSSRTFTDDGKAPQEDKWHEPVIYVDITTYSVMYSTVAVSEDPGTPETNPDNWTTSPVNAQWVASRMEKGTVLYEWNVIRIRGDKGDIGYVHWEDLTDDEKAEAAIQLYFRKYTESAWNVLTKNDTDFSKVPNGIIFIVSDSTEGGAAFDTETGSLILGADSTFDTESGALVLGSTATFDTETGSLII